MSSLLRGKNRKKQRRSKQVFQICSKKDNIKAMFYYGQSLITGEYAYFVKMSVDKGFSIAIHFNRYMHEMGFGIEKNENEALKYYKIAADKGYKKSITKYANMI